MDRGHFANLYAPKSVEKPALVLGTASSAHTPRDDRALRSVSLNSVNLRITTIMKMVVWTEYPLAQLGFSKNFLALGPNGC